MSDDVANEAEWVEKARQVARAVLRSRHPGMSDAEFEKSWSISGPEWRWQYLAGVRAGFHAAGLHKAAEVEWRPIETAPRDGTEIDVWQYLHHPTWGPDECRGLARGWVMPRVRWFSGTWRSFVADDGVVADDEYYKISHWMPLPGPPK